jgi:plastocyanin
MKKKTLAALAAFVALPSCGGSGAAAESHDVTVEHVAFAPASLEVDAGAEVTWTNRDADVVHTATSGIPGDKGVPGLDNGTPPEPDGTFDGEMDGADATFAFTFDEPGTYAYFCRVHQSMTGEIVVR